MADFRDLNNSAETVEDLREWYNLSDSGSGKQITVINNELKNIQFAQEEDRQKYLDIQKQVATGIMSLDNFSNVMYKNKELYVGRKITIVYGPSADLSELNIGDLFYNTDLKIAYRVEDNPKRFKEIDTPSFELAIANENFINDRGKRTFYVGGEDRVFQEGDFFLADNRKLYEYTNGELKLAIQYIDSTFSQTVYQALDDFEKNDFYNATHLIDSSTGEIVSSTEHITKNATSINQIRQDVDGVIIEQEKQVKLTEIALGEDKVLLENAKAEILLQANLKIDKDKTMYLFPSANLYPSNDLYPNDSRKGDIYD